jgi:putative RecB family exonuclease
MSVATLDQPNQVAERLMGRDHISYSAISTFQACPLRFYFRYVLDLPEEFVSASLVFGSAIHAALEFHFLELIEGKKAPGLESLIGAYHNAWNERDNASIRFGSHGSIQSYEKLASQMLAEFQRSAVAHPRGRIVGIEEELMGEIVPGCPDLLARVDLLIDTGNALLVRDFKTARGIWSHDRVTDSASQLLLYHQLAGSLAGGKPIALEFVVLTKTKRIAIDTHPVRPHKKQVERTKRTVERVWQAIQAGHFYPNPSPVQCPSCPYRGACREWTG